MQRTLPWALFLAVSWTWCIGMYLPTLLVRDGGPPFFWAFFIPNVIGAASVGWVLRTRGRGERFVSRFRVPMLWFTGVTIAFQAFFLAWQGVGDALDAMPQTAIGIACGALLVGAAAIARRRVDWVPALAALVCSLAVGVLLVAFPPGPNDSEPLVALAGLSMVTALGFGLCPYLDLSFQRAVQHAARPPAAFTLGFLVIFAATLLVATRGRAVWTPAEPPFFVMTDWLSGVIGAHFGAQAVFTILAHAAAMRATSRAGTQAGLGPDDRPPNDRAGLTAWVIAPIAVGLLIGAGVPFAPTVDLPGFTSPIDAGEFAYRLFLGAYGLVFPVWMLLAIRTAAVSGRTLVWLAAVCALAGPFLWVGSIGRDEVWLIPGVSIVLLAGAVRFVLARPPVGAAA
jgi:hypothetical protein